VNTLLYEEDLRIRLAQAGRSLYAEGLTHDASGNISTRVPGTSRCIIKPSGYRLCDLEPEDFIVVDVETREVLEGDGKPSIETPFHTRLYQLRPQVGSVVHIHPKYSTIMSILGKEIVLMGLDLFSAPALAKGIPLSRFAPPGTDELADNLVEAMREHVACLMPHHGVTAMGKTIDEAANNARVVESLAELNYRVLLAGEPEPLPRTMVELLLRMAEERGLLI